MNRQPFLDEFFKSLDRETKSPVGNRECALRALYLLLDSNRNELPWIDLDDLTTFHKAFRHQDVLGHGKDMVAWQLISVSDALEMIGFCAKKALGKVDDNIER